MIVGLTVANVVQPGAGLNIDPATLDAGAVASYSEQAHETTLAGFLLAIIPTTALSALTDGSILQTLFIAVLFAIAISLVGKPAEPLLDLIERLAMVVFRIVGILMRAAPVGAFGAIAFTIGAYGIGALANLGALVATFYLTSIIFVLVVLGTVARLAGFSILKLIRYLKAELLLVLGTSSSEAALPALIEKMERAGVEKQDRRIGRAYRLFVQSGWDHIYMTLAALFIAQACNVDLPLGRADRVAADRDDQFEGRGGRYRRGLHHARRDALDRAVGSGRGNGIDIRRRSIHVRVSQPDQFHWKRGSDDRCGPLGKRT